MKLKIFNTLSQKIEEVKKPTGRDLKIFVCGPTVYDYPHIGNARTYLVFDSFVRFLRSSGWKVNYLQNITDVDDKIIQRAKEEKQSPAQIAKKFFQIYKKNMRALDISAVTTYAPATKYIKQIIHQVETLIKKGHAYKIENEGYYFDISTFPNYGKLARRTITQAEDGVSRIDEAIHKKNKGDFALWKFSKDGEPSWKTKFGSGRPGWHIEDTAISEKFFGPQYDLHGGAMDLKFPHHEAEIAQQESASGKHPFVRFWMHAGFLNVNGEKMSKSLGNFVTIEDFLKKHRPEILRLITLSNHYRSPLNYTEEVAEQNEKKWSSLLEFVQKLEFVAHQKKPSSSQKTKSLNLKKLEQDFFDALSNDFNTPKALAEIFSLISETNPKMWSLKPQTAENVASSIKKALETLGLVVKTTIPPNLVKKMAKERELCRINKQFTKSDDLRKKINALGFEVEDTPLGPFLYRR